MTRLVSIVTISFNHVEFIEQCILSVLNQDYHNIEYIIVDPGSTDGSREIINKYQHKISKIIFDPDDGPADGLNKGFNLATGDIFYFLNSDDVLEPNVIKKIVKYFYINPEVDVVSGHSWIIDSCGNRLRRFYSDRFSLKMAACEASIISQASTFFRAENFRNVNGFNSLNRIAWDGELFVDMALDGARFSIINDFLSGFRVHKKAITGSGAYSPERILFSKRIYNKIYGTDPDVTSIVLCRIKVYLRKILNYRDTFQRILHGPVFGAKK